MCGICGLFSVDGRPLANRRPIVEAMNAALAHRGPDGEGVFDDALAALGHRRLAIIDRAGGHQPMTNEDETCWIIFNGEIYNHRELRKPLEGKYEFQTQSVDFLLQLIDLLIPQDDRISQSPVARAHRFQAITQGAFRQPAHLLDLRANAIDLALQ
jgi:glutamine phosphoribosylpyrophosphate amidotransferase